MHDLPDFVYFNHEIHVNKGIGCASCHGRVDRDAADVSAEHAADGVVSGLPSQSGGEPAADQRDLQHGVGGPANEKPVWCTATVKGGVPTAQDVSCTTTEPGSGSAAGCALNAPVSAQKAALVSDAE